VLYRVGLGLPYFDVVCSTTTPTCTATANVSFTGTTTFTGTALFANGSAAAPSVAWAADADGTGTGMFRVVADTTGFSANGAEKFRIGTTDITAFQRILPNGNAAIDTGIAAQQWRNVFAGNAILGGGSKNLTSAAGAVNAVRITVGSNTSAAGEVTWAASETNGTEFQHLSGRLRFGCINKGGTITAGVAVIGTDLLVQSSASTLTCTWSTSTGANFCNLDVTCTTGLATPGSIVLNARGDSSVPSANIAPLP